MLEGDKKNAKNTEKARRKAIRGELENRKREVRL